MTPVLALRSVARAFLVLVLASGICGCGPSINCGVFGYSQEDYKSRFDAVLPGIIATVRFTFDPAACSQSCACNTVAFIQIVRIIGLEPPFPFLSADSQQNERIVDSGPKTGWYLDRIQDATSPFFKQNNDGTFVAGDLVTGGNGREALLIDRPAFSQRAWFDAVTVPVCYAGDAQCQDRICGYYNWGFTVEPDKVPGDINDWAVPNQGRYDGTGTSYRAEFDAAIAKWNQLAPKYGKKLVPPLKAFGEP